jgi:hypothetical protein
MMGRMGLMELMECDGCGKRTAPLAGMLELPEDWQLRDVADIGRSARGGSRILTVCPECWGTKTLAEVLGS